MSTTSNRSAAAEGRLRPSFLALVYVNAFITGAVVMGFEMLGSRYLNPFFGSGIYTWAALISTVLAALTAGYFFGGWMADRKPTPAGLGWIIVGGSAYLALIPLFADGMLDQLSSLLGGLADQREFERWGSILGAMLLLFVPLALLGVYSPYAIRLTLRATARSGTVAGRVYGISTLGSIFGTLFVTFYLIPSMGSRHITYLLSAVGVAAGLSFLLYARSRAARGAAIAAALLAVPLLAPPAAVAEPPEARAMPVQVSPSAKEAGERFLEYLRKTGAEVRGGTIEAGPGPTGFRIVGLIVIGGGEQKPEFRAASFEAESFAEREGGAAELGKLTVVDFEGREGDQPRARIARLSADSASWTPSRTEPRFAIRGLAAREIAIMPKSGETVRIASIDAVLLRLDGRAGGAIERLAVRTITVTDKDESGSLGAFDVEQVLAEIPARLVVRGIAFRDFVLNTKDGVGRMASAELLRLEMLNLADRNPADLRALEIAIKGVEAPLTGGSDPAFTREMRELGYSMLKLDAELDYRYEEASKSYNLARLAIDVADVAALDLALRIGGLTPDEIRAALREPERPGQPPGGRENQAALGLMARLNLLSADLAYRDKSILGRLVKREAAKRQTDEASIRTQYKAMVAALRDQQTDPLAREALEAVMAFIDDPGELIVEVRPPAPVSLMVLAAMAASNPAQLRQMLGIKITVKKL